MEFINDIVLKPFYIEQRLKTPSEQTSGDGMKSQDSTILSWFYILFVSDSPFKTLFVILELDILEPSFCFIVFKTSGQDIQTKPLVWTQERYCCIC